MYHLNMYNVFIKGVFAYTSSSFQFVRISLYEREKYYAKLLRIRIDRSDLNENDIFFSRIKLSEWKMD